MAWIVIKVTGGLASLNAPAIIQQCESELYRWRSFSRASNSKGISSPGSTSLHWLTLWVSSVPGPWTSEMESALLLWDSATLWDIYERLVLETALRCGQQRCPMIRSASFLRVFRTQLFHTRDIAYNEPTPDPFMWVKWVPVSRKSILHLISQPTTLYASEPHLKTKRTSATREVKKNVWRLPSNFQ